MMNTHIHANIPHAVLQCMGWWSIYHGMSQEYEFHECCAWISFKYEINDCIDLVCTWGNFFVCYFLLSCNDHCSSNRICIQLRAINCNIDILGSLKGTKLSGSSEIRVAFHSAYWHFVKSAWGCAVHDNCLKRILDPNLSQYRLPITYFSVTQ